MRDNGVGLALKTGLGAGPIEESVLFLPAASSLESMGIAARGLASPSADPI